MLWDARTGNVVESLPAAAQRDLDAVRRKIPTAQLRGMEDKINEWADQTGTEQTDFFASNWKAPGDWNRIANGVFMPLYRACDEHFQRSGWMLG